MSFIINPSRYAETGATLPLDEVTGAWGAWSSYRLLRAAYSGDCIRVREDGGDTEADIGFVDGYLDTAAITSLCGANIGYIRTIYDQSGNGNDLNQTSAGAQPRIYDGSSVINGPALGVPAISFNDVSASELNRWVQTARDNGHDLPISRILLIEPDTWSNGNPFDDGVDFFVTMQQSGVTPDTRIYAGSGVGAIHFNTDEAAIATCLFTGGAGSSIQKNDETATTGNAGSTDPNGYTFSAFGNGTQALWRGYFHEVFIYQSTLSSGDQATLKSNINTEYSVY